MRSALVILLVLLATAHGAAAETGSRQVVFLTGAVGSHVTPEPFKDFWKTGLGAGLGFGYSLNTRVTVIGNFDYNYFGLDSDKAGGLFPGFTNVTSVDRGSLSTLYLWTGLRARVLPASVRSFFRPYVLGGIGYFRLDIDETTILHDGGRTRVDYDPQNVLGVNVGAGVDIPITKRADLFTEGQYVLAHMDDINGVAVDEKMGYILVRAGVSVSVGGAR
ncbi:MAG: outer membrane protein [Candidatus Krumholzibacteriia bacterium]